MKQWLKRFFCKHNLIHTIYGTCENCGKKVIEIGEPAPAIIEQGVKK